MTNRCVLPGAGTGLPHYRKKNLEPDHLHRRGSSHRRCTAQLFWPALTARTRLDEKYGADEALAEERLNAAAEARAKTWWDGTLHRQGKQPRWGTHCLLARLDDTTPEVPTH